jgi:hypothetical protein
MHISHGEAWLLEVAVDLILPIRQLALPSNKLRVWLNRGSHNLNAAQLEYTLRRLFDDGQIFACDLGNERRRIPTDSELADAIAGRIAMAYGLTEQGGEYWESLADPDWSRYFEAIGWNGETVTLFAGSRDRLIELVENSQLLWGARMNAAKLEIGQLHPWQATYWKSLLVGYESVVPYQAYERSAHFAAKERAKYIELRRWCKSICTREGHA